MILLAGDYATPAPFLLLAAVLLMIPGLFFGYFLIQFEIIKKLYIKLNATLKVLFYLLAILILWLLVGGTILLFTILY